MLSKRELFVAYFTYEGFGRACYFRNKQQRIGLRFFRVLMFQMGNLLINLI